MWTLGRVWGAQAPLPARAEIRAELVSAVKERFGTGTWSFGQQAFW